MKVLQILKCWAPVIIVAIILIFFGAVGHYGISSYSYDKGVECVESGLIDAKIKLEISKCRAKKGSFSLKYGRGNTEWSCYSSQDGNYVFEGSKRKKY